MRQDEAEIRKIVQGAIEYLQTDAGGVRPGLKDMGTMMTVTKQRDSREALGCGAGGWQAGLSDIVRAELL